MKAVSERFFEDAEELAIESMKAMKGFLAYQGENPTYYNKARVAAAGLTNYVRLRATETNRIEVEHIIKRRQLPEAE